MSLRTTRSSFDFSPEMPKKTISIMQSSLDKMQNEKDALKKKLDSANKLHAAEIQKIQSENMKVLANAESLQQEHDKKMEQLKLENAARVKTVTDDLTEEIERMKVDHSNLIAEKIQELDKMKELLNKEKDSFAKLTADFTLLQTNHNTLCLKYQTKKARVDALETDSSKLVDSIDIEKRKVLDLEEQLKGAENKLNDWGTFWTEENEKALKLQKDHEKNTKIIDELTRQNKSFERSLAESTVDNESYSCLLKENESLKKDVEHYKNKAERYWRNKKYMESSKKTVVKSLNRYKDAFIEKCLKQDGVDLDKFESGPYRRQANFGDGNSRENRRPWLQSSSRSRSRSPGNRPPKRPLPRDNYRDESHSRELQSRDPRQHRRR